MCQSVQLPLIATNYLSYSISDISIPQQFSILQQLLTEAKLLLL